MQDRQLYAEILGIRAPWFVDRVELKLSDGEVHVHLEHHEVGQWPCPECGEACRQYDHQPERQWRHLDTCQYQTILHAKPPRAECDQHGVRVVKLPWAEPSSRFTALFERLAIDWLTAASQKAVGERLDLSWDEVHGIMERAVERGLERRQAEPLARLGVDEKAFRKGQKYFTLVNDLERSRVLYVAEDRTQTSLDGFWPTLSPEQVASIEAVAMDMWDPYIASVREHVPEAGGKIVFDKFHIAKHLGEAVDRVRRRENKTLRAAGDDRLAGTRYDWLRHPAAMDPKDRREFAALRNSNLKTARAWGHGVVRLPLPTAGEEALSLVAWMGRAQPATTDDRGGADAEATPGEHPHLPATSDHQCGQRVDQLKDPMGEVHGARLPEQEELPDRHLLPLWRFGHGSLMPLKCRKSLFFR
jgi:transposase